MALNYNTESFVNIAEDLKNQVNTNNLPKNQLTNILSQLMNQDASVLDAPEPKKDGDRFDFGFADKAPIRAKNRKIL